MSPVDIGILIAAIAVVVGVVGWGIWRRRHGKGGCGGCSSCPYAQDCSKKPKNENADKK